MKILSLSQQQTSRNNFVQMLFGVLIFAFVIGELGRVLSKFIGGVAQRFLNFIWNKMRSVLITLVLMFGPSAQASAHVKWFVEQVQEAEFVQFSVSEPAVQLGILILLMAVALAIGINRVMIEPPQAIINLGNQWKDKILYLVQFLVGLSLLVTAYNGAIIAPHFGEGGWMMLLLRGVEATAAVLLIANLWVPAAATLLLILLLGCSQIYGPVAPMEYCNLLGIALFLGLTKIPEDYRLAQYRDWALPLLRVCTGWALIVLAFTEKLLNPEMAMRFLAEHDMNFMHWIGIEAYSDYLFVLSAGIAEVLFGLVLILGVVTRINIIALACFMIASNTYFFMTGLNASGMLELFGHMPIFAAAIIFIIYGAGDRLTLSFQTLSSRERAVNLNRS